MLQLVPQEQPWGFTEQAEIINGRIAMAGITFALAASLDPTLKAIVAVYRVARPVLGDVLPDEAAPVLEATDSIVTAIDDYEQAVDAPPPTP